MNQIRNTLLVKFLLQKILLLRIFVTQLKLVIIDIVKKIWPNSVISYKEDSGGCICKINILNFLSITEADFKDYLDDKKKLYEICKYFKDENNKKFNKLIN